ncbi:AlpA family phage regulatory protein [Pseudoalteromonas prydzensis]|nr:AlpA family phage regulatory protein [Pseudoalteromonas prydzensis]
MTAIATQNKHDERVAFSKQVSLGAKSVAWLESEVDDWIMDRLGERG